MEKTNTINDPASALNAVDCTCANLRRTTRVVTKFYEEALKPAGLTPGQFTVLAVLLNRGKRRQTEISELLAMERTTLIRNLKPLETRGLIVSDISGPRHAKTLTITLKGMATHELALAFWQKAQKRIIDELGAEKWSGLMRDLAIMANTIQTTD